MTKLPPALRSIPVDLLRGLAVWLMLLNANRIDKQHWWRQFGHGERFVPTLVDWTYPLFLFCAGVALAFSFERSVEKGGTSEKFFRRLVFRAIRLFLLGAVLIALPQLNSLPLLGTLQCIAGALLIAGAIFCFGGYRAAIFGAVVIQLIGYFISAFPPASIDWMQRWSSDQTLIERTDLALMGRTGGMEGILATLVSSSFVLSGIAAKPFLRSAKLPGAGIVMIALAFFIALVPPAESVAWIPFVSQIFSLSFSLLCVGVSLAAIAVFELLLRSPLRGICTWLFLPFGRNAILAFAGVNAFRKIFLETCLLSCSGTDPTFKRFVLTRLSSAVGVIPANYIFTGLFLGTAWAVCALLWKKEIIVRI